MTERENLKLVLEGKESAWVPRYNLGPNPIGVRSAALASAAIEPLMGTIKPDGGRVDIWGVEYTPTESTDGMALPTPGRFILQDITRWRDVVKAPDVSHVDWEAVAKKSVENINRDEIAVSLGGGGGVFMQLMNLMGFTEGLVAMAEAPDDVYELFDYMTSFYEEPMKKLVHYIKPDLFSLGDDTATARNPFISPKMYRELVKPFHARMAKIATDEGIPVDMHCCGHCEVFIDDWLDFGVRVWNPAQLMNDLVGIKKKYGNRLVLAGCWDSSGPASWSNATEELVRAEVRKSIDTFAPGGGYMFWGSVYGAKGDEHAKLRADWVADEYNKYGRTFYQKKH
jgi:hypothetical protein